MESRHKAAKVYPRGNHYGDVENLMACSVDVEYLRRPFLGDLYESEVQKRTAEEASAQNLP